MTADDRATTLSIASIAGLRVGHWTNLDAGTGCTVVLCEEALVVGVDAPDATNAKTDNRGLVKPWGGPRFEYN